MFKPRKATWVALCAMACLALVGAASASASQFRGEEYPVTVTASSSGGILSFSTAAGVFKCAGGSGGSEATASSDLPLTPSFTNCKLAGIAAKVAGNCTYVLKSTNNSAPYTGSLGVSCAKEGEALVVTKESCTLTIPAQTIPGAIELANSGTGPSRSVTAVANLAALSYSTSTNCQEGHGAESRTDGKVTGTLSLTGRKENAGHALGFYVANNQVEDPAHRFVAAGYPSSVAGSVSAAFSASFKNLICTGSAGTEASLTGPSADLLLSPVLAGCKTFGVSNTVRANGCHMVVRATSATAGTLGVGCDTAGVSIELVNGALGCTITIPVQEGVPGVTLANTGSKGEFNRAVEATLSVSTLQYSETHCGEGGNGSFSNGQLKGAFSLHGNFPAEMWLE